MITNDPTLISILPKFIHSKYNFFTKPVSSATVERSHLKLTMTFLCSIIAEEKS